MSGVRLTSDTNISKADEANEFMDESIVEPVDTEEFGRADIHGKKTDSPHKKKEGSGSKPKRSVQDQLDLTGYAEHVDDSEWVDDQSEAFQQKGLPRNPDLLERENLQNSKGTFKIKLLSRCDDMYSAYRKYASRWQFWVGSDHCYRR